MEYWERRQELADRCACEGALCTARRSPAIPYRRTAFFGQKLPIPPSTIDDVGDALLLLQAGTSRALSAIMMLTSTLER